MPLTLGMAMALFMAASASGIGVDMRISTDSSGNQANLYSVFSSISADGRYVAFRSYASNLVAGDTNLTHDVFVKDTLTGATTRVSTDSGGNQGNNNSYDSAISGDGRYVAFRSNDSNLVTGDTNGTDDVFVKDTQTGATTRVSTDSGGNQGNSWSDIPAISADGRYVSFQSFASNLVAGDTNGVPDIFVKETQTGTTKRVSTDSGGNQGNHNSYYPAISADGRYVAFDSYAFNLVAGDTNSKRDIFRTDTSIACTAGQPALTLSMNGAYWASYPDYADGKLSVNFGVGLPKTDAAYVVQVTGSSATNGVTCDTCPTVASPKSLGNLVNGDSNSFTFKYLIPTGVGSFSASVSASAQDGCGNGYSYP